MERGTDPAVTARQNHKIRVRGALLDYVYGAFRNNARYPEVGAVRAHFLHEKAIVDEVLGEGYMHQAFEQYHLTIKGLGEVRVSAKRDIDLILMVYDGLTQLLNRNTTARYTEEDLQKASNLSLEDTRRGMCHLYFCNAIYNEDTGQIPYEFSGFQIREELVDCRTLADLSSRYENHHRALDAREGTPEITQPVILRNRPNPYEFLPPSTVAISISRDEAFRKYHGSGYLVAGTNLIHTAYHTLHEESGERREAWVRFPGNERSYRCVILARNPERDQAVLQLDQPIMDKKGLRVFPLKPGSFRQGDDIYFAGYPDLGKHNTKELAPKVSKGTIIEIGSSFKGVGDLIGISAAAYGEGMSGGPVYHPASGRVIAVGRSHTEGIKNFFYTTPVEPTLFPDHGRKQDN